MKTSHTKINSQWGHTEYTEGLGVDIDKFWFLLLSIFDYTCGTYLDGMKATGIGIEQLTKFAKAIADNHKGINQFGVSFKKPITLSRER